MGFKVSGGSWALGFGGLGRLRRGLACWVQACGCPNVTNPFAP